MKASGKADALYVKQLTAQGAAMMVLSLLALLVQKYKH